MRQIIVGDSLVFDIENHNFWFGDKNFVPKDPCSGTVKRLQVTYSYDGGDPRTIEREEHSRLVLPEDSVIQRQRSALELSSGLSALPVYAQDLEIELLSIKRGVDYLKFDGESLFLHLKMFSPVDAGFRVMVISLWIADAKYTEEAPSDLSDWYLVEEVDSRYYFTNMSDLSLWKEVQQSGLSAGLHKHGWVGIRVSNVDRIDKDLKKIKISLERAGSRDLYKFIFREWKECEDLILSREMKNNRFPRSPD